MRKLLLFWIVYFALNNPLGAQNPQPTGAQSLQQSVQDAYLISRMAEKFHVQPRPLDDTLSSILYFKVLDELDDQKIFFTKEDIGKLSAYQFRLDDEIRSRQSAFLPLLTAIYKQRVSQADTMIDHITATPFNFHIHEKFTALEAGSYPAGTEGMHVKLYKLLKYYILEGLTDYLVISGKTPSKKFTDSLESILRKKSALAIKRSIKRILQSPKGIDNMIGSIWCQALATCYDPHTAYFQPETKSAFESRLGNKPLSFGLSLTEDEDGNAQIGRLAPGGPAFQSGGINEGDKIQSIQWDNKEPIDVSNAELKEIDAMLSTPGGNKATLTVKKADGLIRQVVLHKEKLDAGEEDDKVKGFILKGTRTVGYISLPAFYSDWENNTGVNGCANDVAKEIIKLKKENIEGLILDLRYNGGGSMQEAIELSGIFIDAGPVAQIKTRDAKIITLKDVNRGTVYDGPLLILVNGLSASASEMVAGTLQDYNRALIAGSPTYGKATAQVVLPMDTTINVDVNNTKAEASSYIKLTTSKLYRITGSTAQVSGVRPDILLPDPPDAYQEREADEKMAIPASSIAANKYYKSLPLLPVAAAQNAARSATDSSLFFRELAREQKQSRAGAGQKEIAGPQKDLQKDLSLYIDDVLEQKKADAGTVPTPPGILTGTAGTTAGHSPPAAADRPFFSVTNPAYEKQRILSDAVLKETNEERKLNVLNDPYISVAYQVLSVMIK